jgi:hypothetical protein
VCYVIDWALGYKFDEEMVYALEGLIMGIGNIPLNK